MLKSMFSFMLIGTLLFSSNPIENIGGNKATADEVSQSVVTLDEVFVSETGILADGKSGDYVGIPSQAFEPRQAFDNVTVDADNVITDTEGNKIGTYSEELTGEVSEEELARPRKAMHMLAATGSSGQEIEINDMRAVVRSGAVLNSNGDYVWTAENSDSGHSFTYRIYYAFSGVGEYAENQIQITIPKSILRDRSGEFADSYELPIPEYTEDDLTDSNLFVYKEDGENLVIFNRLSCSAAQNGYIEVSYTTTKPTFDYADYLSEDAYNEKSGSDPFYAVIKLDNGAAQNSAETKKTPVYIDTTATLRKVKKWNPYSACTEWNNAWGDTVKPANPDDYEYLIWTIDTEANATQPYNLTFRDTFNETDAMLLGYRGSSGTYQPSLTITNSRSEYMTVYVLTAHKKSTYDALLEQNGQYSLNNSVSVTLQPADKVDSTSTLTSRAAYYKQAPHFEHPGGHFYSTKNGYDVSDRVVQNSDYIRDYSLLEFNEDDSAVIGNLKYYTDVYGYAYPWTLPDGVTRDQAAADPGSYYGQKPVTYTLSDNTFYLKEISDEEYSGKLTADDYALEKLTLNYSTVRATYDEESMTFQTQSSLSPDDVITVYAEVGGSGDYIKIADYIPYTGQYNYTAAAAAIVDKSKTGGTNLFFLENVTGFRLETTNAHWYTKLGAYPYVKLKHSDTVDAYAASAIGENSVSKLCLKNTSASKVSQPNSNIVSFTRSADDYITGMIKSSLLKKSFVGATNSSKKREYTVIWNVSMSESYRDNEDTHPIPQQSGVFYDLLPDGAVYKKDSLSVYVGSTKLESWKYTVTVDDNYRDSGRTMLKIAINESADIYRFVYSTIHSWEVIADYGADLLNTVAYETGNSAVADGKTASETQELTESVLMQNLDPSAGDSKRFLYKQYTHTASFLTSANLGLEKKVRGVDKTSFSRSAGTYNDNNYYYNVRFATDDHSQASELIAFDSLENYEVVSGKDAGKTSDWRGIFQGVDTHQLKSLGIAPKVYYSTVSGLNIEQNHNLSDTSVWTLSDSYAGNLSSVKAIAVDMRTATDGSPYVMPINTGAQFTVYMRAPHGVDSGEITPRAFNNIYQNINTINYPSGEETGERLIHQDYTEITLKIVADLELLKVSSEDHNTVVPGIKFSLSGTSDYGTKVNETLYTDAEGKITRRNLEKGTYTLKETETNSDFFLNDTVFTVTVDKNGDLTINGSADVKPYVIENPPRVHGDLEFLKKGKIDGTTDTAPLTGAEFKLEGVSNYGNPVLKYGTSQNGGVVTITDIEWGTYKLTETKAADGYIISTEEYSVVCDKYGIVTLYHIEDGSPVEVKPTENGYSVILNEPLHNFRLVKYDPLNNALLNGAEFSLKGTSNYGTRVDMTETSGTEGADMGVVFFKGLEPGHYTLQETKAPAHYQLDSTVRTVTVSSAGEITVSGLTKMPSDWHSGFYTDCFGVPNTRVYEGEITITKRWLDADGNPITDSSDLPIPVVHVDTKEPVISIPMPDAYVLSGSGLQNSLRSATTFQETTRRYTRSTLPSNAMRVDDFTTRAAIYVWLEGTDAYWWSDAVTAHLPNNCYALFIRKSSLKTVDLSGFDTSNVTNMSYMFFNCSGLTSLDVSGWDTGSVTDMNHMFRYCSGLTSLDVRNWKTGNVTNMTNMFLNCSSLTTLDVSGWDTGKVSGMEGMFRDCSGLTSLNVRNWNTGRVTGMGGMFSGCSGLTSLDVSGFDTSKVTNMGGMFSGCSGLTSLDVSSWITGKVTNMESTFNGCWRLTTLDVSGWDTGSVTNMSYMFYNCSSLPDLDVKKWDTGSVTNMSYMFMYCSHLTAFDVSGLDTGRVTNMRNMFDSCSHLTSLNVNGWDTGSVTNMCSMFSACGNLTTLDVSGWGTGRVANMSGMFRNCSSLTSLNVSGWDTGNVTDMYQMFINCSSLTTLDVRNWKTDRVSGMGEMFRGCSGLTSLDVRNWKTGRVNNMQYLFSGCSSLPDLDVSGFDTSKVTNMSNMFGSCSSLTTLDLSGFDTSKVTDMGVMFGSCWRLTTLDLSGWDTGSVTNMYAMFYGCGNLKTVYVGDLWSTEKVNSSGREMFVGCNAIVGGAGTTYNRSYTDKTYARVDDPPNAPGYFTYKARAATLNTNKASASTGAQASATLLAAAPTLSFLRENGDIITYNARTATLHTNKASASTGAQASATLPAAAPTLSFLRENGDIITYKASAATLNTNKAPVSMGAQASATLPAAAPTLSFLRETGDIITNNAKKALTLTNDGTVSFSQVTNAELWDGTGSAEDKWVDNGDGTWTYKMKVFDVAADYYIWEEPLPGFSCDLDNDTGYTVIHYPTEKNAVITNTRTTDDSCSLTLRKVLTGAVNDYPSEDFANRDYHFTVTLSGSGLAGKKVFGHTTFKDGVAHVTLKGGGMVTFTNIPSGVSYSVTEQEENYGGMIDTIYSPAGTLNADNKNVTFTVTNNVKPSLKSLDITKTVLPYEGGELDDDDLSRVFTFNIDLHADISGVFGDLYFTAGKATAYLKHGETAHITGIPSPADSYTVTEVENSLYTCDKPVQEGELVAGETAYADFKNTKRPEEEKETGGFTITKKVNGKSTDAKFSFNVSMQNLDKNAVYPLSGGTSFTSDSNGTANLTIQLAHGESVKFSDLPVGTVYTVSEQACGYYASYAISGTDRVTPLTDKNTVTDRQLATSAITVQKDDDITIAFTNTDKRFDVRVAKVDADDEFVTDAVLQIIEKGNEENVLDEWVTAEGYHTAQIPQGTYILREKQAPFGYRKADDIEFTVSANGDITINGETVYMIKMVDEPVKLSVTGAGGIYPVIIASAITFTMLLLAVVIKKRSFKNKNRKGE